MTRSDSETLREDIARELFDDTPNDKHGQLCPIWTRRPERRRKNEAGPAWTDCDCWQLNRVRHLADIALGAPQLRAALSSTPPDTDPSGLDAAGTHERTTKPTMEPDPANPALIRQTAYCQWCAFHRPDEDPRWPCETARLLAAIQESRAGGGLDVERLARAHRSLFAETGVGMFGGYVEALAAAYSKDTGSYLPHRHRTTCGANVSSRCTLASWSRHGLIV